MIQTTIETLLEKAKEIARSETVVGEPITAGSVTLIPISKISVGFGTGGFLNDEKKKNSEAATGGIQVTPVAVIAVFEDSAKLLTLDKREQSLSKLIDLVPDVLDRFAPKKKKGGEE
ncbi:MAG TPA: sporulation protein [Candidatus Marinimicrobia bacterium]|nr:sporulation protein [Candidatus Neomarinimicrobiota bacterium]